MIKQLGIFFLILLLCSPFSILCKGFLHKESFYDDDLDVESIIEGIGINNYGGPNLDFSFIYRVLKNLSNMIYFYEKGRYFGSEGEKASMEYLKAEMDEILGPENVTIEKIDAKWTNKDTYFNLHNIINDPDWQIDFWVEDLDKIKNFTKYYFHIKVYYSNNMTLKEERNFTEGMCFPFLKNDIGKNHNITVHDAIVVDAFDESLSNQVILVKEDWEKPNGWTNSPDFGSWWPYIFPFKLMRQAWISNNVDGFILMDCFDNTTFMQLSGTPIFHYMKPGFSINGSSGKWIKQYLNNSKYIVKVNFCSEWAYKKVDSWNIIGEIPGKSSRIAIISNHYDCWWNQGTVDEGVGVATCLGLAKYIKDNNIVPELTLKFIMWGGEEWSYHGARDYIKDHTILKYGSQNNDIIKSSKDYEDIIYVICPGNYGFNKTLNMSFNVGHPRDINLQMFMQNVAKNLNYTERTGIGITGGFSVYGEETYPFYHGHRFPERFCKYAVEIDRFPWPGYHRDGRNHTEGDVFSHINDSLFRVDCEVIAEIILRLIVPKLNIHITRPIEKSFYLRNLRLISLPRNTFIYGPIKIKVDIDSDYEINRVDFYIDNKLKKTDDKEPYSFRWRPLKSFSRTIKIVAYDIYGNFKEEEIQVLKWRVHPLLILSGYLLILK
jgi:hypothetical protein